MPRLFADDLRLAAASAPEIPIFTLAVVALTLLGFAPASAAGINPAWVAAAGALVLAASAAPRSGN